MRWLRKKHLRERYGNVCDKTLERMIDDGRLPAPEFPFGNRIPAWEETKLDAHDRAVVANVKPAHSSKNQREEATA
jgi:hypothetical protein